MNKRFILTKVAGLFFVLSISRLMGFFREMIIAYRFGSGSQTDAFFIASNIHATIYVIFAAGLSASIIPILSSIRDECEPVEESRYISALINFFMIISLVACLLVLLGTEGIVKAFAIGFEGEQLAFTMRLTRLGLPVIFFHALSAIFISYNHSVGFFALPSIESIIFNIPIILYLLLMYEHFGIEGLMVSFVIGYAIRVMITYLPVRKRFQYRKVLFSQKSNIRRTFIIILPIIIGSTVGQVNMIVDRTLASNLVSGSISALTYASRVNASVISLFVFSIVAVVYPGIADHITRKEDKHLQDTITYSINLILMIVMPVMIGILVLHMDMVDILFKRGEFTAQNVMMTSSALVYYSLGLLAAGTGLLIDKIYFSLNDSKTPMKIGIVAVILNIALNLLLIGPMKHNGLALATSISGTTVVVFKLIDLRKKGLPIEFSKIFRTLGMIMIASLMMGLFSYLAARYLWPLNSGTGMERAIKLISVVLSSACIYAVFLYFFKIKEFVEVMHHIWSKWKRIRQ